MKLNLFTTYYKDNNPARQQELQYCIYTNAHAGFDSFNILVEEKDIDFVKEDLTIIEGKYNLIPLAERPIFNDFFIEMDKSKYSDGINIMCNTDIYINNLQPFRDIFERNTDRICVALSRYDLQADGNYVLFERADSQDTWAFAGNPNFRTSMIYGMGLAGCDNKLAYDLNNAGFRLINACKSIKTFHVHVTNIRNYIDASGQVVNRVPPPYHLINPE